MLEDRAERDWEAKKKRVFEELGGRVSVDNNRAVADFKKSMHGKLASSLSAVSTPSLNLQMQNRMMAYDRAVTDLNAARLRKVSFPIVHTFMHVAASLNTPQILQTFHILSKITSEPPAVPVGMINPPILERRFAKQYLGNPVDKDSIALRKQIAKGAREALEEQYWDVMDRTIQSRPTEAMLGGDPSVENKVRAFLFVRYYRNGEWEERIQVRLLPLTRLCGLTFNIDHCWSTNMGSFVLLGANGLHRRSSWRGNSIPGRHKPQRKRFCNFLPCMGRITRTAVGIFILAIVLLSSTML